MKREKQPLRNIIKTGLINGLFFATMMALFDYFNHEPFSLPKFLFHGIGFGFFMALSFRYRYIKDNKK